MGLFSGKTNSNINTDKRSARRFDIFQATYFKLSGSASPKEGLVHNISSSGLLLETDEEILPGERVSITIRLENEILIEECTVIRRERMISLRYGCRFDHGDPEGRRQELILRHTGH